MSFKSVHGMFNTKGSGVFQEGVTFFNIFFNIFCAFNVGRFSENLVKICSSLPEFQSMKFQIFGKTGSRLAQGIFEVNLEKRLLSQTF